MENRRAVGVLKCGRDLEFSGTSKENVLSEVFQITVATNKPDGSLIGCPRSQALPSLVVTAMGCLLCT